MITSLRIRTIQGQNHMEQLVSVSGSTVSPCGQTKPEMVERRLHKGNAQCIQLLSALSQTRLRRGGSPADHCSVASSLFPTTSIPPLSSETSPLSAHTPSSQLLRPFSVQCQDTFHHHNKKRIKSWHSITHLPHLSYNPHVIHS